MPTYISGAGWRTTLATAFLIEDWDSPLPASPRGGVWDSSAFTRERISLYMRRLVGRIFGIGAPHSIRDITRYAWRADTKKRLAGAKDTIS